MHTYITYITPHHITSDDFTSDDIADLLDGDQTGMQRAMELFAEHMGMTFGTDEKTKKGKKQKPVKSKK